MDSGVLCTLCSVFSHCLGQVHSTNYFGITPFPEFSFQEPHTHGRGHWAQLTWSISSVFNFLDHSLSICCSHHRSSTALGPKTSRAKCPGFHNWILFPLQLFAFSPKGYLLVERKHQINWKYTLICSV